MVKNKINASIIRIQIDGFAFILPLFMEPLVST